MATTTEAVKPLALQTKTIDPDARPFLTIDGEKYSLAVPGDHGISVQAKMQRLVVRFENFMEGDAATMTDAEADALEESLHWSTGELVRDCPPEVLAKLDDEQRVAILTAFSESLGAKQAAPRKTKRASVS